MPDRYYWLTCRDQRANNWVFYRQQGNTVVRRSRYDRLACLKCGKFNEDKALADGIDSDVMVQSRDDFLESDDGLFLASTGLAKTVRDAHIRGVRFVALPGDNRYTLIIPALFVETDRAKSSTVFEKKCSKCGRYREVSGMPRISAMDSPPTEGAVFSSSIWLESRLARKTWLYATADAAVLLRSRGFRGLYCTEIPKGSR